ncbi:hypothetical protein N7497_012298 [Penicillium chrysogenum]|nr:hypothetical protein N7497_012298 [Penicillium chrysogenum]
MELSTEPSQPIDSQSPHGPMPPLSTQRRLWLAQAKSLISYKNTPSVDPRYIISYPLAKKRLKFKGYSTGELFGVGCLNLVSIDANYEIHGRKDPTLTDLPPH